MNGRPLLEVYADMTEFHRKVMAPPVASDAGERCHVCGEFVSWVDHLPPLKAGGPVECLRPRPTLTLLQGGRA